MKLGYADPPYMGQSKKHYEDHPDYDGEVDHWDLVRDLETLFDGWVLHASSTSLRDIYAILDDQKVECRTMIWVKSFAAFKRNVSVAYAWEPIIVKAARKPEVTGRVVMRDWIIEPMTMKKGLVGAKPEKVCLYAFEVMGAQPDDDLVDLFPGSGAVSAAWCNWRAGFSVLPPDQMQLL